MLSVSPLSRKGFFHFTNQAALPKADVMADQEHVKMYPIKVDNGHATRQSQVSNGIKIPRISDLASTQ
jgi:hypothetical protein